MSPRGVPTAPFCRFHCASCGRHFTSLQAFDAHRDGDYAERRWCDNPAASRSKKGEPLFELVSDAAVCHNTLAAVLRDVELWGMAGARERASAAFGRAG